MFSTTCKIDDLRHIVAMPRNTSMMTACAQYSVLVSMKDRSGKIPTCLRCWCREFAQWEHEAETTYLKASSPTT